MQAYPGSASEMHPYDAPYAIIQSLRKDVADLRAMLHAEQQQRAQEVEMLKAEVNMLRSATNTDLSPLQAATHKLQVDLETLSSNFSKSMEEFRSTSRQNLSQLNSMLQDEIRDRKQQENVRDSRDKSKDSEWKASFTNFKNEFNAHQQAFNSFKDESVNDVNNLTHDVELVYDSLMKVTSANEGIETAKIITSGGENGNGNGSKYGGSGNGGSSP